VEGRGIGGDREVDVEPVALPQAPRESNWMTTRRAGKRSYRSRDRSAPSHYFEKVGFVECDHARRGGQPRIEDIQPRRKRRVPLYLDVHRRVEEPTAEAMTSAHARDCEVQGTHGVNYLI
jgi:hypothetical protein